MAATDDGTDTTIDFGSGDTITLLGVVESELHSDDFSFAYVVCSSEEGGGPLGPPPSSCAFAAISYAASAFAVAASFSAPGLLNSATVVTNFGCLRPETRKVQR